MVKAFWFSRTMTRSKRALIGSGGLGLRVGMMVLMFFAPCTSKRAPFSLLMVPVCMSKFPRILASVMTMWTTKRTSLPKMPTSKAKSAGSTRTPLMGGGEYSKIGSEIVVVSSPSTSSRTSRNSSGAKICSIVTRSSLYASMFETDIFRFDEVNHSQILL